MPARVRAEDTMVVKKVSVFIDLQIIRYKEFRSEVV